MFCWRNPELAGDMVAKLPPVTVDTLNNAERHVGKQYDGVVDCVIT